MKTILITGATSGIGRAAAIHLVSRGHRVIATGRKDALLSELVDEVSSERLSTLVLDVNDPTSIAAAVRSVNELTEGRGLDVLVNNAGYAQGGAVLEVSIDAVRAQYETNVFGLLAVTQAFTAAMFERGAGRVINIGSMAGRFTFPTTAIYNSTKYAVESLSDGMRVECAAFGIDVVLIEPGAIKTNFNSTLKQKATEDTDAKGRWADANAKFAKVMDDSEGMAAQPHAVAKTIAKAAEAKHPRARYVSPAKDKIGLWLILSLPTWLFDYVRKRMVGLHRPQLPDNS